MSQNNIMSKVKWNIYATRKNMLNLICIYIPFVFRGVDGGAGVGKGDIDLSLKWYVFISEMTVWN